MKLNNIYWLIAPLAAFVMFNSYIQRRSITLLANALTEHHDRLIKLEPSKVFKTVYPLNQAPARRHMIDNIIEKRLKIPRPSIKPYEPKPKTKKIRPLLKKRSSRRHNQMILDIDESQVQSL